ncbi:MAG TPA: prolyl oligopeptidase family serine peptidase [Thermoleophilaceae bacterium]
MRKLTFAGAVAATTILLLPTVAVGAARPHVADGKLGDWRGRASAISGVTNVSRGELVYTDWLYDDFGADTDGLPTNSVAWAFVFYPTVGDYRYPTDEARYGTNAADLRELRIAADRRRLHLLVSLETMIVRDAAAVMLALDTDGDASTGAATWPDGVGIDTPGADRFVTLWGTGGAVRDEAGRALGRPRQAVNLKHNAIEASVSRRLLGRISPKARIWLVTGLANAARGRFQPVSDGSPTAEEPGGGGANATAAFNVAFRPDEPHETFSSYWGDRDQATALARRDVAPFAHPLHLRPLRNRRSVTFKLKPGYHNAVYRSRHELGEGIDLQRANSGPAFALGNTDPQFRSRWQPYGVYVPESYAPGGPLTVVGHASLESHNQYAGSPGLLRQIGEERRSVLITPLGRGHINFYMASGLVDVVEAIEHAQARFRTDPARTSIMGYSMGGYLAFRLGLLMPDRFAVASAYNPPPAYSIWAYPARPVAGDESFVEPGITTKIAANALNLPYEIVAGVNDEEVPISGVRHQVETFEALGNPYRYYEHPVADHLRRRQADEWGHTRDWLGDRRIDPDPARVRYARYPIMDLPRFGLRFDGAYWVDGIALRSADDPGAAGPDEHALVDVTSHALGKPLPATEHEAFAFPGPPLPATVRGRVPVAGEVPPRANRFEAQLTNVERMTLDVGRMGLDPTRPLGARLDGDGTTTLVLVGRFGNVSATLDGDPVGVGRVPGGISVAVDLAGPGPHDLAVHPQE